jgi:tRNA (uracil-5-)-methyltransferase TRM9
MKLGFMYFYYLLFFMFEKLMCSIFTLSYHRYYIYVSYLHHADMNETKYVTEVYNKIGSHFDKTRVNYWNWITDFINKLPKHSTILDNGCGNGRNMQYKDYTFEGIDSSDTFVTMCRQKGLSCKLADMCEIPFSGNSFDVIMSIASFHHLATPERRIKALQEMYRVLKPNGNVILSVWSITQPPKTRRVFTHYGDTIVPWKNTSGTYERYYYIFEIDEICSLFKDVGFKMVSHYWDTGNEIFELTK